MERRKLSNECFNYLINNADDDDGVATTTAATDDDDGDDTTTILICNFIRLLNRNVLNRKLNRFKLAVPFQSCFKNPLFCN